ncbi:DUF1212-domain-containing protein [Dacryopinax primogenitus]|uniref:DUF1212-domain-containing protein n=1 Tax=Dacryopinax primogenitus (strain DJM 731) TaxID=1858805 RepID=M5G0X9_DACPD|nr:DUF1212-domain-containing protein [Dacryopinax primogenitus]EJU01800.1 DUF1212-domain-containing protein [Dacryopinax primogenitus]
MSRISSRESSPEGELKHKRSQNYFSFKHREPTPEEEEKQEEERQKEAERRRRKRQRKRRLEKEIFITMHVAAILQRPEFLLKLARALMMFGAPTHRLEALIQATGRVLDMNVSCVHLPGVMLLSFNDDTTRTSETKFLKQPQALDLERLQDVHAVYNAVIHDKTGVKDASDRLDEIMRGRSRYRALIAIIIGGLCSAFITPISFSGSFLDAMLAFPLGCLLVLIQQLASRNELFTHVFEIVVALLLSFISAALAATNRVCYAAVASGSILLILPGFIVLTGALELASRNIISGSVRLMYAVIYSLFLGFGLAIGGEFYTAITGQKVIGIGLTNGLTCPVHDDNGPWWQQQASPWWAFLCVPGFSFALSLRNQAPWNRKEFVVMILISCAGWATNHFSSLKFVNRTDIIAMLGALVVGVCGNLYGRFIGQGMSFVVMVTGILFQVPSSINGLLSFASLANTGQDSYSAGFNIAEQLIEVSIGLTVGLFIAAVITNPFESRRRGYGLFSF